MAVTSAKEILDFWFVESGAEQWFAKSDTFDAEIRDRFLDTHHAASSGACDNWCDAPESCLALVIVLDQFSRNLFRNSADAFANDAAAYRAANVAIEKGHDWAPGMTNDHRTFFYLPFEHSENRADQQRCLDLMRQSGMDEEKIGYAQAHYDVIAQFGRFPHRNKALGRTNTAEEEIYLQDPNAGF